MDGAAFFAVIQGLGSVCALAFSVLLYMAICNIERHDAFVDLATRSQRKSPFDDLPPPLYHPRRLWRVAFLIMAWIGGGYILFGIASSLVAWMPESWRVWGGDWDGMLVSTITALFAGGFAMFTLPIGWDKITASSRRRRRREDEAYCLSRIEDLITRILTRPADHDGFSATYAERLLRTYVVCGMLNSARADELMVTVKIIEARVRETAPDFDFQKWHDANIAFEVGTLTLKKHLRSEPVKNSDKAWALVRFVKDRQGLALADDGRELRALLPPAPNGLMPPDILADRHHISTLGSYTKIHPAKEKTIRIVEMILWADQAGAIDAVDDYLRNTARWVFVKTKGKEEAYV